MSPGLIEKGSISHLFWGGKVGADVYHSPEDPKAYSDKRML
jgi:hypothetical protein